MLDIEHFKKALTTRRMELAAKITTIEDRLDDPKDPDVEERSVEREEDEVMEIQAKSGYEELQAIDAALGRIENNRYGICHVCEEPISAERLEAVPTTSLCRNCMK